MQVFIDARRTKVKPTPEAIRDLANRVGLIKKYFFPDWILVVSSPFYYRLSRTFAIFVESYGVHVHIYRNLIKAQEAAKKFRTQKTIE
jgi:hypothetical protein